jgi:hypothetical protein
MKTVISSAVSMALGALIGWYVARNCVKHATTEIVEQMVQTMEGSASVEIARDIRAISLIQSGESERAVQSLCAPIASYYYAYDTATGKDVRRLKLRVLIEELARTNKIVADEMKMHMINYSDTKEFGR